LALATSNPPVRTKPDIRIYHTWVSDVQELNPHMVRVTLQGGDLESYQTAGPDSFIYVFFPREGAENKHAIEHDFTWDYWFTLPEADRQVGRYYTVRSFDPARAEMQIDVVVHGDGPGSTWASARAKPGHAVAFWGPRTAYDPPADTAHWLLVADETGLPAIGAILEDLPAGVRAQVIVEVSDESAEVALRSAAALDVRWLHRDGGEAGLTTALVDAVGVAERDATAAYAWGGGEFVSMQVIKAHLLDAGFRKDQLSLVGYWRHPAHTEE
jgi:NADPH-dependent ferric siderophore reductase